MGYKLTSRLMIHSISLWPGDMTISNDDYLESTIIKLYN